jgi:hypothetical protein
MIKIPKVKKSIVNFIKDEKGSISKSNLIKGALFLGMMGGLSSKAFSTTTHKNSVSPDGICSSTCVDHYNHVHSSY